MRAALREIGWYVMTAGLSSLILFFVLGARAEAQVPALCVQYESLMRQSAYEVFGPAAPVADLAGQVMAESGCKNGLVSYAGAQGLTQFMPATAKDAGKRWPSACSPVNPFDARWAFGCRDRYMQSLLKSYSELDECSAWEFAFRAYNGGAGWIKRDREKCALSHGEKFCLEAGGDCACDPAIPGHVAQVNAGRAVSSFKENTEYPRRVFKFSQKFLTWGRQVCK